MLYKRWISWATVLSIILAGVFIVHFPVKAEEEAIPYTIKELKSNINLYEDGSVYFDALVTYQLQEDGAEIIKPIPMAYSSYIEQLEVFHRVYSNPDDKLGDYKDTAHTFNFTQADEEADTYHISIALEGDKLDEGTFVYRYKLQDTVFLYKDTAAFFWQFIMPEQNIEADNVTIEISLPNKASTEECDGYVRGAAYAEKQLLEDGLFRITSERIPDGEFLESVLLMPNSMFPSGRKIVDNLAKDEIAADMTSWEEETAIDRKQDELRYYGSWGIAILSILLSLGVGLMFYIKTKSPKRKGEIPDSHKKGIPDASISPAEAGMLINGRLSGKELFATVLSLIKYRFLEMSFGNDDGILSIREDIQKERLRSHEEYLLNWLIEGVGDGKVLSLKAFENLLDSYKKTYEHKISTWESLIHGRSGKYAFQVHENISWLKVWAMVCAILSLCAAILACRALGNLPAGIISGVTASALIIYVLFRKKVNEDLRLRQVQWDKYKDDLRTQLSSKSKSLSLTQWEEHLLYAIPFGIAEEMLEWLMQNYSSREFEDGNLTILYHSNHSWILKVLQSYRRHFK